MCKISNGWFKRAGRPFTSHGPADRSGSYVDRAFLLGASVLSMLLVTTSPLHAQVQIHELGSWGGRINNLAFKDNVMYFHSGGRLVVADVTNPAAPVELNAIDFRSHTQTIVVRGDVLYVGGDSNNICFRTFDITNPAVPVEMYRGCNFFGGSPKDIVFWNDIAYTFHGTDVHAFDVSDPANPVYHQGVYFSLAGPLAVSGDYLYMLNDNADLLVFDIANAPNPFKPTLVKQFPLPSGSQKGSIAIEGTLAYLQPSEEGTLVVVDISNPLDPAVVTTVPDAGPPHLEVYNNNLAISNGILHVVTEVGGSVGLKLFSLGTAPTLLGTFVTDANVNGVDAVGTTLYLHDEGEGVIVVDAFDPANPVRLGNIHSPEWMRKIARNGDLLYATDQWHGLTILDISDPGHIPMTPLGIHQSSGDENWGIEVQGGLAYLCAGTGGLEIIDVSTPSTPTLIGQYPVPGSITHFDDLAVHNGIAYVGAADDTGICASYLLTFDVSDPANVSLLDSLQIGNRCLVPQVELQISDGSVIVHAINDFGSPVIVNATDPGNLTVLPSSAPLFSSDLAVDAPGALRCTVTVRDELTCGLYIHDVADPASPSLMSFTPLIPESQNVSCQATSVGVFGNLVCAVGCSMHVFDVSNPSAPVKVAESLPNHVPPDLDIRIEGPFMYGVSGRNPAGVTINLVAAPGDFDSDLNVSPSDVNGFVACVLDPTPATCLVADMNDDGASNAADIQLFLEAMLGS